MTYGYDARGQLTTLLNEQSERSTFTYDAAGRSIQKQLANGTRTSMSYDAAGRETNITHFTSGNTAFSSFADTYNAAGNLISQTRDAESSFYHFDPLGSTCELTDESETVTDNYLYSTFGEVKTSLGTTENPYQWVGEQGYYRDAESGLYSLRQRSYDASEGRFQSEDPLGFVAGDNNFYRYVGNNASTDTDPSGLAGATGDSFKCGNKTTYGNYVPKIYCQCETMSGEKKYSWVDVRVSSLGDFEACKAACEAKGKRFTGYANYEEFNEGTRAKLAEEKRKYREAQHRAFLEGILAEATQRVINGNASASTRSGFQSTVGPSGTAVRDVNLAAMDQRVRDLLEKEAQKCDESCIKFNFHDKTDWRGVANTNEAAFTFTEAELKQMIEDEFKHLLKIHAERERIANYNEADEIQAQIDILAFTLALIPGGQIPALLLEIGNAAYSVKRGNYGDAAIRAIPIAGGLIIGVTIRAVQANRTISVLGGVDNAVSDTRLLCETGEGAASLADDGIVVLKTKGASDVPNKVKSGGRVGVKSLGAAEVPRPGRMLVEKGALLDGRKYRDFVVEGRSTFELFAGRLFEGSDVFEVSWTSTLSQSFFNRLKQAQSASGIKFRTIYGNTSSNLLELVKGRNLNVDDIVKRLGESLGGRWKVETVPQKICDGFTLIAKRID